MGIKSANKGLLVVLRCLYATARSTWRAPWQVSGHLYSGAKSAFLFQNSNPFSPRFLRREQAVQGLRVERVCAERTSQAAKWPIGATRTSGHRKLWRHASNAWDMASAAKWWPTLRLACVVWKITGWSPSKKSSAFPSSGFSRRRFRIQMRSLASVVPRHCPVLILRRNPGANAKS